MALDTLKALIKSLGEIGTTVYNVAKGGGRLMDLLSLLGPVSVIKSTNWQEARAERSQVDSDGRLALEAILKQSFKPNNANVELKVDEFIDMGEATAVTILKDIQEGKDAFESLKSLYEQWRSFLGV